MTISITQYNAICNLGNDIDEIYSNAINGYSDAFTISSNHIKGKSIRIGEINSDFPTIKNKDFNTRCNQLILKNLELLKNEITNLIKTYGNDNIAVVVATTNSGVEEFEQTQNIKLCELGNPALFVKEHLSLNNYYATVSTACSSGLKAFSIARNLINSKVAKAVIVVGVDSIAKVPLHGFDSLGILTPEKTNPFSENSTGINIGEACATFVLEDDTQGIEILGIGETSDLYHSTTPDPEAIEVKNAINKTLKDANLTPSDIDYINLHGTGTLANDLTESKAINDIFENKLPTSSTKPLTGHCLGGAASIETALCCVLLDKFENKLYPHVYDGVYNSIFPKIKLVNKNDKFQKCKICMCNSFGFGGTNAIMILGKTNG